MSGSQVKKLSLDVNKTITFFFISNFLSLIMVNIYIVEASYNSFNDGVGKMELSKCVFYHEVF